MVKSSQIGRPSSVGVADDGCLAVNRERARVSALELRAVEKGVSSLWVAPSPGDERRLRRLPEVRSPRGMSPSWAYPARELADRALVWSMAGWCLEIAESRLQYCNCRSTGMFGTQDARADAAALQAGGAGLVDLGVAEATLGANQDAIDAPMVRARGFNVCQRLSIGVQHQARGSLSKPLTKV